MEITEDCFFSFRFKKNNEILPRKEKLLFMNENAVDTRTFDYTWEIIKVIMEKNIIVFGHIFIYAMTGPNLIPLLRIFPESF